MGELRPHVLELDGLVEEGRGDPVSARREQNALQRLTGAQPIRRRVAGRAEHDEQWRSNGELAIALGFGVAAIEATDDERRRESACAREASGAARDAVAAPAAGADEPARQLAAKCRVAELLAVGA